MNKRILVLVILVIVIIIVAVVFVFVPAKNNPPVVVEGIQIISPKANEEVSSPLKITGLVNGNGWAGFEGQVGTVKLLDGRYLDGMGKEMASGVLTATTEWTKLPTNFETTLNFQANGAQSGVLVFHNENPSGLPEKDKTFVLPVIIKQAGETTAVKAFFGKKEITGSTCSVVFPVDRIVPKTEAVARTALEQLLAGPTEDEKAQGYFTEINPGVKIQNLTIDENGTAYVDFSSELETTGGSCRVTEIRSEINFTLKQFSTIKNVVISINGETETILQP